MTLRTSLKERRGSLKLVWTIYTLSHPQSGKVRYVGSTTEPPQTRLKGHIRESLKMRTGKDRWILSLRNFGAVPVIRVIDAGYGEGMADAERRWIAHYRTNGARLLNKTVGGEGCLRWRRVSSAELDALAIRADDSDWDVFEGDGPDDECAD